MSGVLVRVEDDEGLRVLGFDVFAGATLAVTTGADFEVAVGGERGKRGRGKGKKGGERWIRQFRSG